MTQNKEPLMRTFLLYSATVYFIILVLGSVSFILSMQQIISTNKGNELSQLLETERIRLELSLNSEIAIALKMASSPLIKNHLLTPSDAIMEAVAMEEIASYRRAFIANSVFWINDEDRLFYSDDNEPYWLDADNPVNYWYNMTLYETEVYNFNINYNPDLNMIRLWVNAPVFDDEGNAIGMVGTGIELSAFVDAIYRNIDEQIALYFFISDGTIYGARDVGLIIDSANISDVIQGIEIDILDEIKNLEPGKTKLFDVPNGVAAITSVPMLDWYSFSIVTNSMADYLTPMTALFFVFIVVILLIIIIFNVFVAIFLKTLSKASESLATVAKMREQALMADNEMLDRVNRMKNEFLQNMNHEFKTPLNVISTSVSNVVDMCDFELDESIIKEVLGNAQREIMRMSRMVDSAMRYSSLQDNRQDMNSIDMAPLLREGAETYRAVLERQGNTLSLDCPTTLPPILGNSDMLLHVLSNLMSNANRYTRNGMIFIQALVQDDSIAVIVRDNGAGISAELLPMIFERGVSESGTGLGLSICKSAVEDHGGKIGVESSKGEGTTVWFTIPILDIETGDKTDRGFS